MGSPKENVDEAAIRFLDDDDWERKLYDLKRDDLWFFVDFFSLSLPTEIRTGPLLWEVVKAVKAYKESILEVSHGEKTPGSNEKQDRVRQELAGRSGDLQLDISREQSKIKDLEFKSLQLQAEETAKDRQHEKELLELQIKLSGDNSTYINNNFNLMTAIKLIPCFIEEDVPEFFTAFERIAIKLSWPRDMWTTLVQCKLKGKAQRVYNTLSDEFSSDYDIVKSIIMKAYDLVPEAYRQKFRDLRKDLDTTFIEFARKKGQFFEDWLRSKEVDNFDKLKELILIEEFKRMVSKNLKIHLEELKIDSLQEIAIADYEYSLARRQESGKREINFGKEVSPHDKLRKSNKPKETSFVVKDENNYSGIEEKHCLCDGSLLEFGVPVSIVTRSRSKGVDLEEIDLDLESVNSQVTDFVTGGKLSSIIFDDVDWEPEALKEAQSKEFNDVTTESILNNSSKPYFVKEDGLLYRVSRAVEAPADQIEVVRQLVVPEKYRRKLLWLSHENNLAGHFSVRKTFQKLAEHFFWPGMRTDVKNHVHSCNTCQIVGKLNQKVPRAPLIPIPAVGEPFREVIVDVVGPLPRTRSGNEYILSIIDRMSRFPEAIPLRRIGIFGHSVRGPLDVVREHWEGETPEVNVLDYVSHLQAKLQNAWCFAKENLAKGQPVMKSNYDIKSRRREFSPGDRVLVLLPMPGNPLKAQFSGPWRILKKMSEVNYLVETPGRRRKSQHCHINMLKPYVSRSSEEVEVGPISLVEVVTEVDEELTIGPNNLSNNSDVLNNLSLKFQLNPVKMDIVKEEVKYMLDHNLITPSTNPWSSPVVFVKKEGGQNRLCFDYHKINEVTKTDSYPLPRVEDCIDRIGSAKFIRNPLRAQFSGPWKVLKKYNDVNYLIETPGKRRKTRVCHINMLKPYVSRDVELVENVDVDPVTLVNVEVDTEVDTVESVVNDKLSVTPDALNSNSEILNNLQIKFQHLDHDRVEDCIDRVGSAKFLTKLDLLKGYWQVGLSPRARRISAFVTGYGLFECKVMPFGMKNAAATFQRLMNYITQNLEGCVVYIDDLIIYSDDWKTHLKRLRALFQVLRMAGLVVNLKKSDFAQAKVIYLGHEVGLGKVTPKKANVEAVADFPVPLNKRGVRRFLGMVGYYREFICNLPDIANPLTNLLKKGFRFNWSADCQGAFERLKATLISYPLLRSPDFKLPFRLGTDASDLGLGAVLLQEDDKGTLHPVAYFSKKLSTAKRKYSTIEKEALCLIKALTHFDVYLSNSKYPIVVYTDHNPLVFIRRFKDKIMRILRWCLTLQEYDLEIRHITGRDNVIHDVMSRTFTME
ncbi:uncharacterized protein [Palaemon carinicauda]|uniref:uncharacterized protein n=1 Tax=Palaemon carinicauda TaxID=392227 RepID=UPI0035B62A68